MIGETIFDFARFYRKLGWSVFPIQYRNKTPLIKWGIFQTRLPNDAEIAAWFNHNMPINIGVVTGNISNIVVLDVDNIDAIKGRQIPVTPCSKTGRGGFHYFFKWPGRPTKNFVKVANLDLRGDGGYVILSPSVHENGNVYDWLISPEEACFADIPDWLLALPNDNSFVRNSKTKIPFDDCILEGKRNNTLTALAGAMRGFGVAEKNILSVLLDENQRRCKPPLPDAEIYQITFSVAKYTPNHES